MAGKQVVLRRGVGAAVVFVFALAVVGPVAAGKKPPPPSGDRTSPTAPTNLRVTSFGQTSVTLAWDPSTDNSGSFSYSVNKDGQGFTVPQTRTSFTIDWLSAGRTYTFYVNAVDGSLNTSGRSNIVTVTTLPDTAAPPAPTLSGQVRGPSQVRLTWNRVEDDTSEFVTYRVFANGSQVTQHVNWYGETDVVLRHLTPATTYTFSVKALDASSNTSTSNAITLTTEASTDVTPPSVPTNVRIVGSNGCPEFWVGWAQSTDDTDPQSLIEYEIYVNGVLSPLAVSAGVDNDFVYATASGANTFTVKAVDEAGNTSKASNGVTEFC
ncbi:MAG: fibronectin type III domain-containing protein [Gaiellaceae bacterium]